MDTTMDVMGGPSSSAQPSLADLLQQSRKLNTHLSGSRADLPSIQLGLDQIEAQSRKLAQARATTVGASSSSGAGIGNDARAHYFLANGGIDASGLADTINQTDIANAFEPLQPIYDTDVESYLRHSHEQVILSAIEEGRRETLQDFHRNLAKTQARDWEMQKIRILEELGQHQNAESSQEARLGASTRAGMDDAGFRSSRGFSLGRSELSQSQGANGGGGGSVGNVRVSKYQAVVERLNSYRLDSTPFALASAFGESTRSAVLGPGATGADGGQGSQDVYDCWQALSCLVGETDVEDGNFKGIAVRERQYANAYAGVESQRSSEGEERELRKTLVAGALTFLNRHLTNHIEGRIAANPVKAQLGGRPNVVSRIVAFERVAFTDRDGKWSSDLEVISTGSGSVPAWSTVFFLLCTGNAPSALTFVSENEEAFRRLEGANVGSGFLSYLKAWLDSPDGRLPKLLRDRFVAEYNTRFRGSGLLSSEAGSTDVYKQSLYRLIGRIDVNKSFASAVTKDTETWLWLQLSLVREMGGEGEQADFGESLRDQFTLQDLGTKIVKFGEKHFDGKGNRPLHYFMLLLLCGQFERAIGFLYSRLPNQVDAVNFAVTLAYYGLLRIPPQSKASHIDYLSSSTDASTGQEVMTIDFAKLIQKYVRLFSKQDAKSALQYVYLVCLSSDCKRPVGEEQTRRCHDLVRTLVVDSRQYFELLGDVRNDGTKTPGLIERNLRLIRLQDSRDFLTTIVAAAAIQSENENQTRDAILLYNIAEEYDRVIDVINGELSSSLVEPVGRPLSITDAPAPAASLADVEDISQLASAILDNYEKHNHIQRSISPRKKETCRILLALKTCFQLFSQSEWEKALNMLESLDLIPFKGDVVTITRKAESFKDVDDSIANNFSQILLLAMNAISKLYLSLKDTLFGDGSRQQRMTEYRSKARALMLFAGMLRLRIEPSTFSQLTRLDVYLH